MSRILFILLALGCLAFDIPPIPKSAPRAPAVWYFMVTQNGEAGCGARAISWTNSRLDSSVSLAWEAPT